MIRFYATIEFLSDQAAGILTLTNQAGEWAGSGRIEVCSGLRYDIYEEAYRQASLNAQAKGGRLERLSVVRASCPYRKELQVSRRAANALNVEVGAPVPRCMEKKPEHWPRWASAVRWVGSGGELYVFGYCDSECPLEASRDRA